MYHEAGSVLSSLALFIQATGEQTNTERVKKGFTQLLGGISKVLTVPPDDDDQDDALRVTQSGGLEVFDKAKVCL